MSTTPPVKPLEGHATSIDAACPFPRMPVPGRPPPLSAPPFTRAPDGAPRAFIEQLCCPYCGSGLELQSPCPAQAPNVEYGVLRCACYEYPILKGIILLQQRSPYFPGDIEQAMRHLRAAEYEQALVSAFWLSPGQDQRWMRTLARWRVPRVGRLLERARRQRVRDVLHDPSLSFHQAVMRLRAPSYARYLFHRYANPSFLAAVLLNALFADTFGRADAVNGVAGVPEGPRPAPRVLDLGCGVGHVSSHLADLFPGAVVVACDCDFTNLYIARRFLIPGRICIGLDLEAPLPFPDGCFDAVLCSDAFHYVRSKAALLREVDRVADDQALWLFSHLHNSLVANPTPGLPLAPSEYRRLFDLMDGRLIPEIDLLRRFSRERSLDFTEVSGEESLRSAHALEWVGGRDPGRWRKRLENVTLPVSTRSPLGINPIYEVRDTGDHLDCRLAWPDRAIEAECGAVQEFLPAQCAIDKSLLSRVVRGSTTAEDDRRLQALLHSFVLVHLPAGYGNVEIAAYTPAAAP